MKKIVMAFTCLVLSAGVFAATGTPGKTNFKTLGKTTFDSTDPMAKSASQSTQSAASKEEKPFCRVCCTVSVPDPFGGLIGITACAGWLLTSCETAGERACEKAMTNAMEALLDSN